MNDRRLAFAVSTVTCSFVLYGVYVSMILYRIVKYFGICILRSGSRDDGAFKIFGQVFPVWEVAVAAGFLPVGVLVYPLYAKLRRRYRDKHDLCIACGHPITDWHGRCPGCGVRVGPDPDVVVHVIRG